MSNIVQRLKQYLDFKGINVSASEKEIGVSNGSLSKPFKYNTTIKTDTLEKFLKKYSDINPEWLFNEVGDIIKTDAEIKEEGLYIIELQKYKINQLEKEIRILKSKNSELKKDVGQDNIGQLHVAEPPSEELIKLKK